MPNIANVQGFGCGCESVSQKLMSNSFLYVGNAVSTVIHLTYIPPIFLSSSVPTMAPYNVPENVPVLQPRRLVLVPVCCFYCGHSVEEDIQQWTIHRLFGLFHCTAHQSAATRDCSAFMREHNIVRLQDARTHPVLGPFLTALGPTIPVLRSSGAVDTNWYFPLLDDEPPIRKSRTTGAWGFNLTNGFADKFAALADFRDPRVAPHVKPEARDMLDAVEAALNEGVYSSA
jgi:hypothetical protein